MLKGQDWIPRKEEELVKLIAVWQAKLIDSNLQNTYGWAADECNSVKNTITEFITARNAANAVPIPGNYTEKKEKKAAAITVLRKFASEFIRFNSRMPDGLKKEMGLTVNDPNPSPIVTPDMGPESTTEINSREPGVVKVRYSGAKPYGVDRVEIVWSVLEAPADSPDQLVNRETFSHNPWERTFASGDRGKRVYYSLRYLTRDGASHWSEVCNTMIP